MSDTATDYSRFRFTGGIMRGLLVSSAPTSHIRGVLEHIPAQTETAKACRWELARREAERAGEVRV